MHSILFFLPHFISLFSQGLPGQPSLTLLDSSSLSFRSSLGSLDRMPTRYCDTVFVMYCSKGQTKPEEILRTQVNEGRFSLPYVNSCLVLMSDCGYVQAVMHDKLWIYLPSLSSPSSLFKTSPVSTYSFCMVWVGLLIHSGTQDSLGN